MRLELEQVYGKWSGSRHAFSSAALVDWPTEPREDKRGEITDFRADSTANGQGEATKLPERWRVGRHRSNPIKSRRFHQKFARWTNAMFHFVGRGWRQTLPAKIRQRRRIVRPNVGLLPARRGASVSFCPILRWVKQQEPRFGNTYGFCRTFFIGVKLNRPKMDRDLRQTRTVWASCVACHNFPGDNSPF
jgi:hypothetical protein